MASRSVGRCVSGRWSVDLIKRTGKDRNEESFMVIRIGEIMKTSNRKFHIGEIKFSRYRENEKIVY